MTTHTAVGGENDVAKTVVTMCDQTAWLITMVYSASKGILYCVYCNSPIDEVRELEPYFDLFQVEEGE